MSVIVNLLLALMRVHQPVSRPMSTLLFCYVGDCQFVACLGACPSAHFLSDVHVAVCYVVDCQFVAFWPACPSARFPSDVHGVALSYRWLSTCCLLSSVSISPFFVRCPRCCFVMSVFINLLSFGRCGHQPFSRPMSTLLFVMSVIVNLLLALVCVHQPIFCPMSTRRDFVTIGLCTVC